MRLLRKDYLLTLVTRSFGLDTRALSAFRIALASLVIADLLRRARDFTAHYTDGGVLPKAALIEQGINTFSHLISLHLVSGTVWWQAGLWGVALFAAVAMLVGYRTRAAIFLVWYFTLSLHVSQPLLLQRGDVLLLVLLFWSLFLPLARHLSVDQAVRAAAGTRSPHGVVVSVASAALTLQVLFVYFFAYFHKSSDIWRSELLAVEYALLLDRFVTAFGSWLVQFSWLTSSLTFLTLLVQLMALPLILAPFRSVCPRLLMLGALAMMHVSFIFTLHLGHFPYVSLVSLLVLLPAPVWDAVVARVRPTRSVAIYYDADCGFCRRSTWLIVVLGMVHTRHVGPAQANPVIHEALEREYSWVVVDEKGVQRYRFAAGVAIARASVWLRPLVYLASVPAIARFGDAVYAWVAAHRSQIPTPQAPLVPLRQSAGLLSELGVVVFRGGILWLLIVTMLYNIATVTAVQPPTWAQAVMELTGLRQNWSVFAPVPSTKDGWYQHRATTTSGQVVDVFLGTAPIEEKPPNVAVLYQNQRWRKYLANISFEYYAWARPYYGAWLCSNWNRRNTTEPVSVIEVRFMHEATTRVGEMPVVPETLYIASCELNNSLKVPESEL